MDAQDSTTRPTRMIGVHCPLCGADESTPHLSAGDAVFGFAGVFHVVRCRACDMLYTNPQVAPSELGRFYPPEYAAHAADRAARQRASWRDRDPWDRLPEFGKKRLLDVGCGSGGYLLRQKQRGWEGVGVEPSSLAVEAARRYGLNVIEGVIPGADLPQREFEVITLLGVLGCIPNPMATLTALRPMLVPGGRLIVSAHNAASNIAAIMGGDWLGWDLPRHQNHFTPRTLTRMIEQACFADVRLFWKRRTSRWRHGAKRRAAATGRVRWKVLAGSRNLCSLMAIWMSRGEKSDEMVAVARG